MFEEEFFATMSAETRKMVEYEWRMLAMEKELADITSVSKAALEVHYPRDRSMFNDYHKSPNRNYYVDMTKQSLPFEISERTTKPNIDTLVPWKYLARHISPVMRDIATSFREALLSVKRVVEGTMPLEELTKCQPDAMRVATRPSTIARTSTRRCCRAMRISWTTRTTIGTTCLAI